VIPFCRTLRPRANLIDFFRSLLALSCRLEMVLIGGRRRRAKGRLNDGWIIVTHAGSANPSLTLPPLFPVMNSIKALIPNDKTLEIVCSAIIWLFDELSGFE
jgi:hypothetical protein